MSNPKEKSIATTAACTVAYPILASHLVSGFSGLARLNLSMYAATLASTQNKRENMSPPQKPEPIGWNCAGMLPAFASQFAEQTSAVMDMTLQASVALNRLALDGYLESIRHAASAIAAMARNLGSADAPMKSAGPAPDDSGCAVAAMVPAALPDIARGATDTAARAVLAGHRRRSPSR